MYTYFWFNDTPMIWKKYRLTYGNLCPTELVNNNDDSVKPVWLDKPFWQIFRPIAQMDA